MAFADYVPEMFEILRGQGEARGVEKGLEKGKVEVIKRLLVKKLKSEPNNKIQMLIENANAEKFEIIEDRIFEITSWEEVEEIIKEKAPAL